MIGFLCEPTPNQATYSGLPICRKKYKCKQLKGRVGIICLQLNKDKYYLVPFFGLGNECQPGRTVHLSKKPTPTFFMLGTSLKIQLTHPHNSVHQPPDNLVIMPFFVDI